MTTTKLVSAVRVPPTLPLAANEALDPIWVAHVESLKSPTRTLPVASAVRPVTVRVSLIWVIGVLCGTGVFGETTIGSLVQSLVEPTLFPSPL